MKSIQMNHGVITICDTDEPQLQRPSDVKIKIAYTSICGYEIMLYRNKSSFTENMLGHEASGIVVEAGAAAQGLHVGDAVTLNPSSYCGICSSCRKGLFEYCLNLEQDYAGFMREYVVVNERQVFRLPSSLDLREGCLIEPLLVTLQALEKARLGYDRKLLIVGGGAMGQLLLKAAQVYPIEGVVLLDPNASKRALAEANGAAFALDPRSEDLYYYLMDYTNGTGFDAIIEASGDSKFVAKAYNLLARGGDFVLLSMYEVDFQLPIPALHLYWKNASINAVYPNYSQFSKAVSIAPRLDLHPIITEVFPYVQAPEAFEKKARDHDQVKIVLSW